jgi:hypothetical protein
MDLSKILELIGADQLAPDAQGQIKECLEILISDPAYIPAMEKTLDLIGATKLDPDTQRTVRGNLRSVIDVAAKELLETVGSVKAAELRQVRRKDFEKRVISLLYCGVAKDKTSLIENSDQDIERLARTDSGKAGKISKTNFKWDSGYGSEPFKATAEKVIKASDFKWESDGLSPLSGKTYRTNTKGGR